MPVSVSGNRIGFGATTTKSGWPPCDVAEMGSVRVGRLLSSVKVPVKVPADVGAKLTVTLHVAPGASGAEQLFVSERLGSPDTAMLVSESVP